MNTKHSLWYEHGINREFWNQIVRPTILRKWNNKCSQCGMNGKLDIHHIDYNNQTIETMVPLCRRCHRNV